MHLKYPRRKDFFSWEELGCFARSLGFQKNLFIKNIPEEIEKDKLQGLDKKFILYLLEIKALHGDLHRTYNMHDAFYNCKVVEKAMDMVLNRYLSFNELKEARVAFQLYEHEDMMGLVVDQHILLRTLKICGRIVSPVKLMQYVKHMKRHSPERLLLYEFLDLLLLCERESQVEVRAASRPFGLDRHHLYKMADFESVLMPNEEKIRQQLDHSYEIGLNKGLTGDKKQASWRDKEFWLVDSQPRLDMVTRGQQRSAHLGDHLNHSEKKVRHARCGYLGDASGNPSFVDLNDAIKKRPSLFGSPTHFTDEGNEELQRIDTRVSFAPLAEQATHLLPSPKTPTSASQQFRGTRRDQLSRTSREGQLDILVSPRDLHNSVTRMENLQWDIETQGERLKQKYNKRLKEKSPRHFQLILRAREAKQEGNHENQDKLSLTKFESKQNPLSEIQTEEQQAKLRPRKREIPKRDSIFKHLMTRLNRENTLLDFGGIEVPVTRMTSSFEHGNLLPWPQSKPSLQARNRLRTLVPEQYTSIRSILSREEMIENKLKNVEIESW